MKCQGKYPGQERDAFQALCLEHRHDCFNDCVVVATEGLILENGQKRVNDDGLEVVVGCGCRCMLCDRDLIHSSHSSLTWCIVFWSRLRMDEIK